MVLTDTAPAADTRPYVSELRQQQAAATRERVVRAAAELFTEKGYAATTMPSIARQAGVSTETVQNHGPKVELLRAAIAIVSFGSRPGAAVADTELGATMLAASTPEEAARFGAELLATVNSGAHGVWTAFSEAARSDQKLAAELRRLTAELTEQNHAVLEVWRRHGWLRRDLSADALVLRATAIGSIELWDRVVRLDGHTREEYVDLVAGLLYDTMATTGSRRGPDEFSPTEESKQA